MNFIRKKGYKQYYQTSD